MVSTEILHQEKMMIRAFRRERSVQCLHARVNGCAREKDCGREKILEQKIGMRQKAKNYSKGNGLTSI